MHGQPIAKIRYMGHWVVILGLALLIAVACVSLWHLPGLRPYLVGLGAALAAFLAPLPGLLTPETRGKWPLAILLASAVGVGTWYSSDKMERERGQLEQRLQLQRESFVASIGGLPGDGRSGVLLSAAGRLKELLNQRQPRSVLDLAQVLEAIDQENGHALYYAGEAYRLLKDRTDMRGAWQHYLAAAQDHSEALQGAAHECYMRPTGYCGERTAWIDHLMANDYYQEASSLRGGREVSSLGTAFKYERHVLDIRPQGFYADQSAVSSCGLLEGIAAQLATAGQPTKGVGSALEQYRSRYGPC